MSSVTLIGEVMILTWKIMKLLMMSHENFKTIFYYVAWCFYCCTVSTEIDIIGNSQKYYLVSVINVIQKIEACQWFNYKTWKIRSCL